MMTEQTREQLVNRVTTLRGENKSRSEMAETLNNEGLKTPAGKAWTDVLIGAFMNRMSITTASPVVSSVKTETKEIKPGKEINTVATKSKGKSKGAKVFKRVAAPAVTAEFGQGKTTFASSSDQDLIAIVASVISGPLTKEQKVRAFSALI